MVLPGSCKQVALSNDTIYRTINDLSIRVSRKYLRSSKLELQGFYTKNLVLIGLVYRCIQLRSVNLFVCYIKKNKVEKEFCFVNHY